MSSLFSNINGFDEKVVKQFVQKYDKNDGDFSGVDFCVNSFGEDIAPFDFAVDFDTFNSRKEATIDEFKFNYENSDMFGSSSSLDFEG